MIGQSVERGDRDVLPTGLDMKHMGAVNADGRSDLGLCLPCLCSSSANPLP